MEQYIGAGDGISLCIDGEGNVWGFGSNVKGSLGLGNEMAVLIPKRIGIKRIKSLSVGQRHCICVSDTGNAYSFGSGSYGRLGLGDSDNRSSPCLISSLEGKVKISFCGSWHSFCIDFDNRVHAFGYNTDGKLGIGNWKSQVYPVLIENLFNIIHISCGNWHTLFLSESGEVYGSGSNGCSQLHCNSSIQMHTPEKLNIPHTILSTACGWNTSFFLSDIGNLYSLGIGKELKLIDLEHIDSPIKSIYANGFIIMIITIDGKLYAHGRKYINLRFQKHNLSPTEWLDEKFQPFHNLNDVYSVGIGVNHCIIQTANGNYAIGKNDCGELGIGKKSEFEKELVELPDIDIIIPPFSKQKSARNIVR